MKIAAIAKLIIGALMLLGVLNGIKGIVNTASKAEAAGYLTAMALFLIIGL